MLAFLPGNDTIVTMPIYAVESKKSSQTFRFHNTLVREHDYVEWYIVSEPGETLFCRLRNHSTGAEMKLTPRELYFVRRVVLGEILESALQQP
jgi:hypothetical protein